MEFKEIAAVKGMGGLFQVLKASELRIIIRPLEESKGRVVAVPKHLVSMLTDVSLYTKDEAAPLHKVLQNIWKKCAETLPVTTDSDTDSLKTFMKSVLPEYNEERVYISDIKKLIRWYALLLQHLPEALKVDPTPTKKSAPAKKAKKVPSKKVFPKKTSNTPSTKRKATTPPSRKPSV